MSEITKNPCQDDSPIKQEIETAAVKGVQKIKQTQNASVVTDASRVSKTMLCKIQCSEPRDGADGVSLIREMRYTTRRI